MACTPIDIRYDNIHGMPKLHDSLQGGHGLVQECVSMDIGKEDLARRPTHLMKVLNKKLTFLLASIKNMLIKLDVENKSFTATRLVC